MNSSAAIVAAPLSFKNACLFIEANHRHHKPPQGWKFGISAVIDQKTVGVAVVSRPVSRMLDDGLTCEVTRLCSNGASNVCSFLYGACARAAKAMGYRRVITYILESEPGTSLRAAGWKYGHTTAGGSWNRKRRPRKDNAPLEPKQFWYREF